MVLSFTAFGVATKRARHGIAPRIRGHLWSLTVEITLGS
jgi:hypothetical protein